jgi:hypothetical protein
MNEPEDAYPCVGVCLFDPDNGYCLGCGRPPQPVSTFGQGAGSKGENEKSQSPYSVSATNPEPPIDNSITASSQNT